MKQVAMPVAELGIIAATRGIGGAAIGLLIADRIPKDRRTKIALPMLAIGVLSTIPLAVDIIRKARANSAPEPKLEGDPLE